MRVGVFLGNFSETSGGGFRFESEIIKALIATPESKHEFFYLAFEGNSAPAGIDPKKFIQVCTGPRTGPGKDNRDEAPEPRGLSRFLKKSFKENQKPEPPSLHNGIVHMDDIGLLQLGMIWYLTPSFVDLKVPFLATVWDLQHRKQPFFPEVSVTGWTWEGRENHYRQMLPKATFVLCPNETASAEIQRFYGLEAERIKCIPHPVPEFARTAEPRKSDVGFQQNESFIFYPAQFWPHKNHVCLLNAVKKLKERHGHLLKVRFSGSDTGNWGYVSRHAEQLGISDLVTNLGFVPQSQLMELYKNCFGMVYPSFFGPENLPPLEAMAIGCPVAVAQVAGSSEQFSDHAHFFDPADDESLFKVLLGWIQHTESRFEKCKEARIWANRFTFRSYIEHVTAAIDAFAPYRATWDTLNPYIHT